jgi:hypothetical protein
MSVHEPPPNSPPYVDPLRLAGDKWDPTLDALVAQHTAHPDANHRRHARAVYNTVEALYLEVQHPGGTAGHFLVKPRDISRSGLGFLHGGFLYPGTRCTITLALGDGRMVRVRASVRHCTLLRGRVHFVGVQFEEVIDKLIAPPPAPCAHGSKPDAAQHGNKGRGVGIHQRA